MCSIFLPVRRNLCYGSAFHRSWRAEVTVCRVFLLIFFLYILYFFLIYIFVWKKAVTKNQVKLFDRILVLVEECEALYGLRIVHHGKVSIRTLKRLRKKLYRIRKEEGIVFVHGTGKRKTRLQKSIETLEAYLDKLKEYNHKLHVCADRNNYSKTDPDATFMRMKEDAMQNGQLKPAYNLQHGVDSEYITWLDLSSRPTDTGTLIPFLKDMKEHLPFQFQEIVADAGYESECSVLTFTSCRRMNRRY